MIQDNSAEQNLENGQGRNSQYPQIGKSNSPSKTESNLIQVPSIKLPEGGGAIKSIDEKFEVNASNGTASFSIPFPASPGRNGFTPGLSMSYNSGAGNSIVGIGWSMGVPSISRKTEKKLPEYQDENDSDIFIFSGAEDLVPVFPQNQDDTERGITRYRPRIEGGFAKIERIQDGLYSWWRVTTRDNIVSVFGQSPTTRIADPQDDTRIFQWLLEFTYDNKGSYTEYRYMPEDLTNVESVLAEKNRLNGNAASTNTYLKSIHYGNVVPFYEGDSPPDQFLFEIVLDYGEHDTESPTTERVNPWPVRQDAFSSYRSGFEIRTWRLCRRVLMFHHFPDELGLTDYLVRSMDFEYDENPHLTYLESVTQTGYIWNPDGSLRSQRSLPPLTFTYHKPGFNRKVEVLSKESLANLPYGLDPQNYQWTDLFSEGISGILSEQSDGWYYKENLGDGEFTPAQLVSPKPSLVGLAGGALQLQDLEANGQKYLVSTAPNLKGYYELSMEEEWQTFRPFEKYPTIDFRNPNVKFLDLNGDGLADILITEEDVFHRYSAKGKVGYDDHATIQRAQDEEKGPKVLFSSSDERILVALADMVGDGLTDIVRITNQEICYWPNLGYGKFGAKVTLGDSSNFGYIFSDHPDLFNPQFVQLADIDGSGTTDIVYVGRKDIQVWFNQSGNSLSEASTIFNPFPQIDNFSRISVIDLLGNGTSCITWSSSLPEYAESPLRYIDLMRGRKPHVMFQYINNMGKEVSWGF